MGGKKSSVQYFSDPPPLYIYWGRGGLKNPFLFFPMSLNLKVNLILISVESHFKFWLPQTVTR